MQVLVASSGKELGHFCVQQLYSYHLNPLSGFVEQTGLDSHIGGGLVKLNCVVDTTTTNVIKKKTNVFFISCSIYLLILISVLEIISTYSFGYGSLIFLIRYLYN